MSDTQARRGALEAIERILNRGGDPERVLDETVAVVRGLYPEAEIVAATGGDTNGFPIRRDGLAVAELRVGAAPTAEGRAFLERVATLVSPYC